jgi:hypothetical protein
MAEQPIAPEIIPHDQAVDFLLGAVIYLIDRAPARSLLFALGDLRFDPTRHLQIEIRVDDIVEFSLDEASLQ